MSTPEVLPRIGAVVERIQGQQQMVVAIYPAVEAAGIPVRVQLAGDPQGSLWEWGWLVDAGYVTAP